MATKPLIKAISVSNIFQSSNPPPHIGIWISCCAKSTQFHIVVHPDGPITIQRLILNTVKNNHYRSDPLDRDRTVRMYHSVKPRAFYTTPNPDPSYSHVRVALQKYIQNRQTTEREHQIYVFS
jgi:hypothetical protein